MSEQATKLYQVIVPNDVVATWLKDAGLAITKPYNFKLYVRSMFGVILNRPEVIGFLSNYTKKFSNDPIILKSVENSLFLEFQNPNDAVMFKLTWC